MAQDADLLSGEVEVDEAYIGGRRKGPRGRGARNKIPVVGMVERKGNIRVVIAEDTTRYNLRKIIKKNVKVGTRIITDDYTSYHRIDELGYKHDIIRHSDYIYVLDDIHTNTIEGFWSQLKRSLRGTHHSISPAHLQSYLDEFVWKYNRRASSEPAFPALLGKVSLPRD